MLANELFVSLVLPVAFLVLISSTARYIHLQLFSRYFNLTFENSPVWSFFYFSFWTGVVSVFFGKELWVLFGQISLIGYLILFILLFIIFPYIYRTMKSHVGSPEWLREVYPSEGMLTLEERYIFAKIGDVIFQQSIAGAMLVVLVSQGFEYQHVTAVFLVLFVLAHVYIFATAGLMWGMHFTAYAVLGGFAFPYLIIFVPAGIAYSIVLHMLFYVLSAVFFAKLPHPSLAVQKHLA